jgi:acetyltransferase-like isoleucine patch superfamily enzyme
MENIFFNIDDLKYCGENVIIGKSVRIRNPEKVSIGSNTIIDDFTYISCELEIGEYCHISSNVHFGGGKSKITIGNYVGIATGCSIHGCSSDYMEISLDLPSVPEDKKYGGKCSPIIIEDYCLLGSHTVVLPGTHLPEGLATGAHMVVGGQKYKSWTLYYNQSNIKQVKRKNLNYEK